jgi:hypothetical protein
MVAITRIENGPSEKNIIDDGVHSTYLDSRIPDKSSVQWYNMNIAKKKIVVITMVLFVFRTR